MFIIKLSILFGVSFQACLPSNILQTLGTPIALTKYPSATVCKNLFVEHGACIDPAQLETFIKGKRTATETDQVGKMTNLNGKLTSLTTQVKNICTKISAKGVGGKAYGNTVTQDHLDRCTQLNTQLSDSANVVTRTESKTVRDTCFKAVNTLLNGSYCLLASGKATDHVTVSATGTTINIPAKSATASFDACVTLISTSCLLSQIDTLLSQIRKKDPKNKKSTDACKNLTTINSCIADATKCTEAMKTSIFLAIFAPGNIALGDTAPTTIAEDATAASATPERLLQTTTDFTYTISTTGFEVTSDTTGLSTTTVSSIERVLMCLGIFIALI